MTQIPENHIADESSPLESTESPKAQFSETGSSETSSPNLGDAWIAALDGLRGSISDETFVAWLEPIEFLGLTKSHAETIVLLAVPNRFFADWVSNRYLTDLLQAFGAQISSHASSSSETSSLSVRWSYKETSAGFVSSPGTLSSPGVLSSPGTLSAAGTFSAAGTLSAARASSSGNLSAPRASSAGNRSAARATSPGSLAAANYNRLAGTPLITSPGFVPAASLSAARVDLKPSRPSARYLSRPASKVDPRTGELPLASASASSSFGASSFGTNSLGNGPQADLWNSPTANGNLSAPHADASAHPFAGTRSSNDFARPDRENLEQKYALNPRYHLDNFVVGPSNQLAHAASVAAGNNPGRKYNPLFIYSKVGLGKTHLVNAVGHKITENAPNARVMFLSAEHFTNEFIWALKNQRIDEFRNRYRNQCDCLIIDDIQFLAGREQTQEEFFHTFNALYHADKQIIVTSDVYPQHISEMQERLISRFQWGLVADIQAPELDTRIAILRKKAEHENIPLTDEVALLIAQLVQSNVRELEGTLIRLSVQADAERRPGIDLALVRSMLGEAKAKTATRQLSVEDVQKASAEYFNIRLSDLKSIKRHRSVALPRMVAMYLSREHLQLSFPDLGARFGGKDHTTILHAHRKIKNLLEAKDPSIERAIEVITKKLLG